jgi:hypothetical protein
MGSRPLANALMGSPPGTLIAQGFNYQFSSVFFYTGRSALLYSKERVNLEYGSYAPGAPHVFITDSEFQRDWNDASRYYLLTFEPDLPKYASLVGATCLYPVASSGGKLLLTNHPLTSAASPNNRTSSSSN